MAPLTTWAAAGLVIGASDTAGQPKPNMTFKTWGPTGTDFRDSTEVPLLGLAADSNWLLSAPYSFDRTMIRDQLAYDLSNEMGMWAPHWRQVEVYLNRSSDRIVSAADYAGIYVLMDEVEQGTNRVDVANITPEDNQEPDISGGYIWKIDRDRPGWLGLYSRGTNRSVGVSREPQQSYGPSRPEGNCAAATMGSGLLQRIRQHAAHTRTLPIPTATRNTSTRNRGSTTTC